MHAPLRMEHAQGNRDTPREKQRIPQVGVTDQARMVVTRLRSDHTR
jgi:hypothetical protein